MQSNNHHLVLANKVRLPQKHSISVIEKSLINVQQSHKRTNQLAVTTALNILATNPTQDQLVKPKQMPSPTETRRYVNIGGYKKSYSINEVGKENRNPNEMHQQGTSAQKNAQKPLRPNSALSKPTENQSYNQSKKTEKQGVHVLMFHPSSGRKQNSSPLKVDLTHYATVPVQSSSKQILSENFIREFQSATLQKNEASNVAPFDSVSSFSNNADSAQQKNKSPRKILQIRASVKRSQTKEKISQSPSVAGNSPNNSIMIDSAARVKPADGSANRQAAHQSKECSDFIVSFEDTVKKAKGSDEKELFKQLVILGPAKVQTESAIKQQNEIAFQTFRKKDGQQESPLNKKSHQLSFCDQISLNVLDSKASSSEPTCQEGQLNHKANLIASKSSQNDEVLTSENYRSSTKLGVKYCKQHPNRMARYLTQIDNIGSENRNNHSKNTLSQCQLTEYYCSKCAVRLVTQFGQKVKQIQSKNEQCGKSPKSNTKTCETIEGNQNWVSHQEITQFLEVTTSSDHFKYSQANTSDDAKSWRLAAISSFLHRAKSLSPIIWSAQRLLGQAQLEVSQSFKKHKADLDQYFSQIIDQVKQLHLESLNQLTAAKYSLQQCLNKEFNKCSELSAELNCLVGDVEPFMPNIVSGRQVSDSNFESVMLLHCSELSQIQGQIEKSRAAVTEKKLVVKLAKGDLSDLVGLFGAWITVQAKTTEQIEIKRKEKINLKTQSPQQAAVWEENQLYSRRGSYLADKFKDPRDQIGHIKDQSINQQEELRISFG